MRPRPGRYRLRTDKYDTSKAPEPPAGKQEKPGKKKRAKKDPNEPKRGLSAYFLWMNAQGRAQVKAENPELKMTEIGRKCGEVWGTMGDEAKAEWEDKAKADKARYEREMANYTPPPQEESDSDDE